VKQEFTSLIPQPELSEQSNVGIQPRLIFMLFQCAVSIANVLFPARSGSVLYSKTSQKLQ
jgi:hypothetical protein